MSILEHGSRSCAINHCVYIYIMCNWEGAWDQSAILLDGTLDYNNTNRDMKTQHNSPTQCIVYIEKSCFFRSSLQ